LLSSRRYAICISAWQEQVVDFQSRGHESRKRSTFLGSSDFASIRAYRSKKLSSEGYSVLMAGVLVVVEIGIVSI